MCVSCVWGGGGGTCNGIHACLGVCNIGTVVCTPLQLRPLHYITDSINVQFV